MSHEVQALAEALSQATCVLANDPSRGGAVVEQIPYVPSEDVIDFPKIVLGSAACVIAYAWAAFEFGKVSGDGCVSYANRFGRQILRIIQMS